MIATRYPSPPDCDLGVLTQLSVLLESGRRPGHPGPAASDARAQCRETGARHTVDARGSDVRTRKLGPMGGRSDLADPEARKS